MLAYAIIGGNISAIELLVHHGADCNAWITRHDNKKLPLLALATLTGNADIVKLVLAFGASPGSIPKELWKSLALGYRLRESDSTKKDAGQTTWAADSAVELLKRALTHHMVYLLREAAGISPLTSTATRCVTDKLFAQAITAFVRIFDVV